MTPEEKDIAYTQGADRAWLRMLGECVRALGYNSPEHNANRWILERADAVLKLREICEDFGDNDWPSDLHLTDVLEKHLLRRLHEDGRGDDMLVTIGELKHWLVEYPDRVIGDLVAAYLDARIAESA